MAEQEEKKQSYSWEQTRLGSDPPFHQLVKKELEEEPDEYGGMHGVCCR